MKYNMKIDLWIKLLFYGSIGLLVGPLLAIPGDEMVFYILIVLPTVGMILWLMHGSYYQLRDDDLYMRIGPFFSKVPYGNIKSVSLSKNWSSSWAMSMKRIFIVVHEKTVFKGDVQISPIDRMEFMDELTRRCRNLD